MRFVQAGVATIIVAASVAFAVPRGDSFSATMTGGSERPNPVVTTAVGNATFAVSHDTVTFSLTVSGLSGPATGAHIHGPADTNQAAGVLYAFTLNAPSATGTIASGSFTRPSAGGVSQDSLIALLRAGKAYVNVHTAAHPAGEIRGQIMEH